MDGTPLCRRLCAATAGNVSENRLADPVIFYPKRKRGIPIATIILSSRSQDNQANFPTFQELQCLQKSTRLSEQKRFLDLIDYLITDVPMTRFPDVPISNHAETSDPTFSPMTTRLIFPCTFRLKMTMGNLFSWQSEIAVASMTRRPRLSTSM